MDSKLDEIKRDESLMKAWLEKSGAEHISGKQWRCGFHEDHKPSGGLQLDENGFWRYTCYSKNCAFEYGSVIDVRAMVENTSPENVIREMCGTRKYNTMKKENPPKIWNTKEEMIADIKTWGRLKEINEYINENYTFKYFPNGSEDKKFTYAHRMADGRYINKRRDGLHPIWNADKIKDYEQVALVEGEKCARIIDRCEMSGIIATTVAGGCTRAPHADWSPLSGKHVKIWGDKDTSGRDYVKESIKQLKQLPIQPKSISVVDIDTLDLPVGGDVHDYIKTIDNVTKELASEKVFAILEDAIPIETPSVGLKKYFKAIISGEYREEDFPFKTLTYVSAALRPGTTTVVCGHGGSGKSFFMLQCMSYWLEHGVSAALYNIESDMNFHLHRALAQRVGCSSLADIKWVNENEYEAMKYHDDNSEYIDRLGNNIFVSGKEKIDANGIIAWIEKQAQCGRRIIAVDPISLVKVGTNRVDDDDKMCSAINKVTTEYGVSVILVIHPRKGSADPPSLDDLAGASVYQRITDTVIWIKRPETPIQVEVMAFPENVLCECNRIVTVLKARNGRRENAKIAFNFSGNDLLYEDLGLIAPKKKREVNHE